MSRFAYTLLLRLLAPLLWAWMAVRARKTGGKWGIFCRTRFGFPPAQAPATGRIEQRVWIHAVSLGETRAARPLIEGLLIGGYPVLLTHTTLTGRREGGRAFGNALDSGQLMQTWLPYDFPGSVRRFFRYFRPRCGILIEREVWPNLLFEAKRIRISMLMVNARFSDSSLRQTRWARKLFREAYASLDLVLAQSDSDAERLKKAGAHGPHVLGNLKFDVSIPPSQVSAGRAWREAVGRPVIALASTREGEEEMFLEVLRNLAARDSVDGCKGESTAIPQVPNDILYLVIPRHPQRFNAVASLLAGHGIRFSRRSDPSGGEITNDTLVYLGDSLGEMPFYYAASDVAIVAGGFAPLGGQNLIEACASGAATIVGPHMFNFAQATADAVAVGAAIQVDSAATAVEEAWRLIADHPLREKMQEAALRWSSSHGGATMRTLSAIRPWIGSPS